MGSIKKGRCSAFEDIDPESENQLIPVHPSATFEPSITYYFSCSSDQTAKFSCNLKCIIEEK